MTLLCFFIISSVYNQINIICFICSEEAIVFVNGKFKDEKKQIQPAQKYERTEVNVNYQFVCTIIFLSPRRKAQRYRLLQAATYFRALPLLL